MPSRRIAKVNRAILEALSSAILFELRDPRVKNVTILGVETTEDLKAAKIRVGVRGDAKVQSLTLHGLDSSRGFLQSKIAERLETRYTPILKFVLEPNWLDALRATSEGLQVAEIAASLPEQDSADQNSTDQEQFSEEDDCLAESDDDVEADDEEEADDELE